MKYVSLNAHVSGLHPNKFILGPLVTVTRLTVSPSRQPLLQQPVQRSWLQDFPEYLSIISDEKTLTLLSSNLQTFLYRIRLNL